MTPDLRAALEQHRESRSVWDGSHDKALNSAPYCPVCGGAWPCDARALKRVAIHLDVLKMLSSPHANKRTRVAIILLWRRDRRSL